MANIQRNFVAGRMNKSLDERLLPNGEYVNALNVRLGSTEETEIGDLGCRCAIVQIYDFWTWHDLG